MTVIAFDGRYMAADSRRIASYLEDTAQKLCIIDNPSEPVRVLMGYGDESALMAVFEWYGGDLDRPTIGEESVGGFVWEETGDFYSFDDYLIQIPVSPPCAGGSGAGFAMGALHHGANSMEAIEIAIRCDPASGGPILYVDTDLATLSIEIWDG